MVYAFLPLYAVDALGATEGSAARLLTWLLVGGCAGGFGMGIVRDYTSQRTVVVLTGILNLLAAVAVSAWVWHEAGKHGLLPHTVEWLTMQTLGPLCFLIGASMEATWTIHVRHLTSPPLPPSPPSPPLPPPPPFTAGERLPAEP